MNLPITVPLTRPITIGDMTISELKFDEADLSAQIDFAELEGSMVKLGTDVDDHGVERPVYSNHDGARAHLFWVSRLAGISEEAAGKIKSSDHGAVSEAVDKIMTMEAGISDQVVGDAGNESPAT